MTRILLLSCSSRKDPRPGLLPAETRYTGVFFRVVSKARRESYWPSDLELAIISARYGFLTASSPIEWYDQKLNRARALELREEVGRTLDAFLRQICCQEVFVAMGALYRLSLSCSQELRRLDREGCVGWARGSGTGVMLQQTRTWLLKERRE
jgi:hypothetical protein